MLYNIWSSKQIKENVEQNHIAETAHATTCNHQPSNNSLLTHSFLPFSLIHKQNQGTDENGNNKRLPHNWHSSWNVHRFLPQGTMDLTGCRCNHFNSITVCWCIRMGRSVRSIKIRVLQPNSLCVHVASYRLPGSFKQAFRETYELIKKAIEKDDPEELFLICSPEIISRFIDLSRFAFDAQLTDPVTTSDPMSAASLAWSNTAFDRTLLCTILASALRFKATRVMQRLDDMIPPGQDLQTSVCCFFHCRVTNKAGCIDSSLVTWTNFVTCLFLSFKTGTEWRPWS